MPQGSAGSTTSSSRNTAVQKSAVKGRGGLGELVGDFEFKFLHRMRDGSG